ncbi:MAG: hypothetical protein CMF38_05030 [Legionellaceae bacterium]|nr:hypothetical protein [Legionellaceae bacterium]HCA89968.1 hypothetical protein [Legionellales bacterium]|tara:strand:- start:1513 stop:3645 length:2133 start_codon:yes stop_codon:yes gene_type:complete
MSASDHSLNNDLIDNDTTAAHHLHVAGSLTAQEKIKKQARHLQLAEQLHRQKFIYYFYSALDGLNLACTATKYGFDVLYSNTSFIAADKMHDWMITPAGIILTATQSVLMILFSISNNFDDKNFIKRTIGYLWPYFREIKGLKNVYKGTRYLLQISNLLSGQNFNLFILPLALPVGALSFLNRLRSRYRVNYRKSLMDENHNYLKTLMAEENQIFTIEDYEDSQKFIQKQLFYAKEGLLEAGLSGLLDSPYLYIGILSMCMFSWPLLIALSVVCSLYALSCILTRMYEEHANQQKLRITQAKIDLIAYTKACYPTLLELATNLEQDENTQAQIQEIIENLRQKRQYLQKVSTLSLSSALLVGLSQGLAAYGALCSSLFFISTIMLLFSFSLPPAFLAACIFSGLFFIAGFMLHSLIHHIRHTDTLCKPEFHYQELTECLANKQALSADELHKTLESQLTLKPSPRFFFQEWFEIIRSFFSGLGKGPKSIDYTLNPLQRADNMGHYHESSLMIGLSIAASCLYCVVYGLRALAKGFRKTAVEIVAEYPTLTILPVKSPDEIMYIEEEEPSTDDTPENIIEYDDFSNASKKLETPATSPIRSPEDEQQALKQLSDMHEEDSFDTSEESIEMAILNKSSSDTTYINDDQRNPANPPISNKLWGDEEFIRPTSIPQTLYNSASSRNRPRVRRERSISDNSLGLLPCRSSYLLGY